VARIAYLTSVAPAQLAGFDFAFLTLPLEVHDHAGRMVASLMLRASWQSTRWEGFATSVAVGQSVMRELEASLSADPLALQPYELQGPGRDKIGWDGQSFLGAKRVERPTFQPTPPRYEFRVAKSARRIEEMADPKQRRFTETWPPLSLQGSLPNWEVVYTENIRPKRDEETLRPASNQRVIERRIAYTAGEAWLPDGRVLPCLIEVDEGLPHGVTFFDRADAWDVPCYDARFDHGVVPIVMLTKEQEALFPMRVVSRLSQSVRNPDKTMRFEIGKDGWMRPWKFKG
jgi:hypothetical protein